MISEIKDHWGRIGYSIQSDDKLPIKLFDQLIIMINDPPEAIHSRHLFLEFKGNIGVTVNKPEVKQLIKILYRFYKNSLYW